MARSFAVFAACAVLALLVAGVPPASSQGGAGPAVAVAVLDSGIDAAHAEFQGVAVARRSFTQPTLPATPVPGLPDPFALRLDPDGQGTGVASRLAGRTAGVTHNASLVDLQVSGKYTGTQLDPLTEDSAKDAMDWLLDNVGGNGSARPRVALLSFASRDLTGPGAASLASQAQGLWEAGVLVVVPAGGNSSLHASPYVLTVAGIEGPNCATPRPASSANPLKPDLAAVSVNLQVASPSDPTNPNAPTTAQRSGTPYAAAAVAGAAVEAWRARGDLPVAVLAAILRDASQDLGVAGPDGCTGYGALDVGAVVAAARAWTDPTPLEPLAKPTPALGVLGFFAALSLAVSRRR